MPGYFPTVMEHFFNSLRSVSEPYKKGVKPPLRNERESIYYFHLLSSWLFVIVKSLTAAREKARCASCSWGVKYAFSQHWRPPWGSKDHPRWLEREQAPQDHRLSPLGEEGRGGPCGVRPRPQNRRALTMCSRRLIRPLPSWSQQNPQPPRSFNCCKRNCRTFSKNDTGSQPLTRPARRQLLTPFLDTYPETSRV